MFIKGLLRYCDLCNEKEVDGFHFFARGATGRVCNVMDICHECDGNSHDRKDASLEEVEAWAESVPNGYLDY
jgi:hypothetical protein